MTWIEELKTSIVYADMSEYQRKGVEYLFEDLLTKNRQELVKSILGEINVQRLNSVDTIIKVIRDKYGK